MSRAITMSGEPRPVHFARRSLLTVVLGLVLLGGCARPPQLGGDEDCLAATDALWTAITSKRLGLVEASAKEIEALHGEGVMRDDAFEALSTIIQAARGEKWTEARTSLKKFVQAQRSAKPK